MWNGGKDVHNSSSNRDIIQRISLSYPVYYGNRSHSRNFVSRASLAFYRSAQNP